MRRCVAILSVIAALAVATPAVAADAAPAPVAVTAPKRLTMTTTMHYPTLEKMLRRFSGQAGETRTRG